MPPISKSDKQTWEDYIANFNSFNINLVNNSKNLVNTKKKKNFSNPAKSF